MEEHCCWWVVALPARSKQVGERYPEFARPVMSWSTCVRRDKNGKGTYAVREVLLLDGSSSDTASGTCTAGRQEDNPYLLLLNLRLLNRLPL